MTSPLYLKNILLTGRPGCGKTTVLVRLAERLNTPRAAGFYTEERRAGGKRCGFAVRTLRGKAGTLSSIHLRSGPRVGKYRVDITAFEEIVLPELARPWNEVDVFLVDEIGKMECLSRRFVEAIERILDGPVPVVATVGRYGPEFARRVLVRPDARLIEVTPANRDALPDRILRLVADAGCG